MPVIRAIAHSSWFALALRNLLCSSRYLGVFACLAALAACAAGQGAKDRTAEQIIADVQANEELYKNIEIVYVIRTKQINANHGRPPDLVYSDRTVRYRCILQGLLLRIDQNDEGVVESGKTARAVTKVGYNGKTTRINQNDQIYNIVHDRKEVEGLLRPHNFIFGTAMFAPLSVWLRSGEPLRKHPGAEYGWSAADIRPTYLGEEVIRNIRCVKLQCACLFQDSEGVWKLGETETMWLSPAHNYLPVQAECVKENTPHCPQSQVSCEDFREIQQGIWFPYKTVITRFDRWASTAANRIVDHVETYEVELAKPDPGYPVSVFEDIPIPPGAVVYEIANGEIINSYYHGDSEATTPSVLARARHLWLLISLGLVVTAFSIYYLVRSRRGSAAPADGGSARPSDSVSPPSAEVPDPRTR